MGDDADFVPGLHSVGAPLDAGRTDVSWPCNETKYISHFPEEREIWSFGSGYGGNSLLGKKCYSLRIASRDGPGRGLARRAHADPQADLAASRRSTTSPAAFPRACGKTNLAMLEPTIPGWKVETLGDDIAWMRFGEDGRLYAVNPEYGLFGVAPGTGWKTNPNAMRTIAKGNSIFTNVALTDDGDIWWEGMGGAAGAPDRLEGPGLDAGLRRAVVATRTRASARRSGSARSWRREYEDPRGVPISAILFGGRRKTTIPLVTEARDWVHGVFLGATLSSETTAAATGAGRRGAPRPDGDAAVHRLPRRRLLRGTGSRWARAPAATPTKLPKIFYVNWFRRGDDGRFLWPGFGENSRVLKWVVERIEGTAAAVETPIGYVPTAGGARRHRAGPDRRRTWSRAAGATPRSGGPRCRRSRSGSSKFGDKLPGVLWAELDALKARLGVE